MKKQNGGETKEKIEECIPEWRKVFENKIKIERENNGQNNKKRQIEE